MIEWKRSQIKLRLDVINGYGGRCSCCGESNYEFLSLDHVNGGGTKHLGGNTRTGNRRGHYREARNKNFPPEYRVLCHNCNFAIGHYGYCPHRNLVASMETAKRNHDVMISYLKLEVK